MPRRDIHVRMHRIRLLTLGALLAAFIGVVLSRYWYFVPGIVIAVIVFLIFAIAAFVKSGPGWSQDDDDDQNSWHRRMR